MWTEPHFERAVWQSDGGLAARIAIMPEQAALTSHQAPSMKTFLNNGG
jgi:hypothetical protein